MLFAFSSQAQEVFYLTDHLGSTRVVTDGLGSEQARYSYYPYGEIFSPHPSPSPQRGEGWGEGDLSYLFTGQKFDSETNLHYYGARYYDPQLACFISIDPLKNNSPYTYANNNPLGFVDPNGRDPEDWRFAAGMIAATSPFYDPRTAPKDFAFQWGAFAGSTYRMVAGVAGMVGGGAASIGSPPTAVATVPLTLVATGITVDAYYDARTSLKTAWEARGNSFSSAGRRGPTAENGYAGPEGGWSNGRETLDRENFDRLAEYWGKSQHLILQENVGENGLIYGIEGELAEGLYIFNVDGEGNIYFNAADLEESPFGRRFGHSSLVGGENSYGAGYFEFEGGKMTNIIDWTGHYKTNLDQFGGYLGNLLNDAGVALNETQFTRYTNVPR
ncbi:MAG: RHS repeat-associated core domain-containing protein [Deltaproteobacteria bacterium]|nr:RHS repeat-associated core domain-containing protein [Deltaproteobacteria bacterium]